MPLPPVPTDLFSTQIAPAVDEARAVVASLGLRPYRVYLIQTRWNGPSRGEGGVAGITYTEILPSPDVHFYSVHLIASSGGVLVDGQAELRKVTRTLTREQLRGKTLEGDDPAPNETFEIGLVALGQLMMELYVPAGEPVLYPLEWRLPIKPTNKRRPGPNAS